MTLHSTRPIRAAGKAALALPLLLLIGGCTSVRQYVANGFKVGPNYARPAAPVADDWIDAADDRLRPAPGDHPAWWCSFGDPVLTRLIGIAHQQNLSLREAAWRIQEAQSRRTIAAGNLFPQQQEATADYTRNQRSLNIGGIPTSLPASVLGPRAVSNYSLGGRLAWELDFWGRYRRAVEASDARLDASVEDYDDVLVMLLAETALAYIDVRTFEQRLEFAAENARQQEESARIANARQEAGQENSELDAPQARSNLAQTRAIIEGLEISRRQAQNRLAVLLGMPPHDLTYLLGPGAQIPDPPAEVAVGVPAELLRRRPDVRRAERELAARSAEIGVAVTDLYPQISINGSLTVQAAKFERLFDESAWAGSVGPSLRWNILNYGRVLAGINVQDARFQQQVFAYQQTVLVANQEAEDAIVAFLHFDRQVAFLEESVKQAQEAERVALAKYPSVIDFNRLFTVQQFLVSQQDQLATARGNLAGSVVNLYRALGGGWQIRIQGLGCPPEQMLFDAPGTAEHVPSPPTTPEPNLEIQ